MLIKTENNIRTAELFWEDLSKAAQDELSSLIGDNGNFDVFPIAEVTIDCEE